MAPIALIWGQSGHIAPKAGRVRATAEAGGDTAALLQPRVTPALRLNTDAGRRYRPEALADLADNAARLAALKDEAGRQADLFSRGQRLFLDAYFRFAAEAVREAGTALAASLAWSGGLFAPDDLVFSALKPLPRAVIAEGERVTSADFAFWDGERIIAVTLRPPTRADQSPHGDALHCLVLTPAELAAGPDIFRGSRFPETLRRFFAGETVPKGPFRPLGLPQALDPIA